LVVSHIKSELRSIPYQKVINRKSKLSQKVLQIFINKQQATEINLNKMKWEDNRKLVQAIFGGKDINASRAGVYVRKNDKGVLEYEIRGDLLDDFIDKKQEGNDVQQNSDGNSLYYCRDQRMW
jgi:hypothetical protein